MKIYTSYFYQIRFFNPTIVPLSTAVFDPKWFNQWCGQGFQFKDKNGVWNGLRAEPFVPGAACEDLCHGVQFCKVKDSTKCDYMKIYAEQLNKLNFEEIIERFRTLGKKIQEVDGLPTIPDFALIVHEAPSNPCSERWVIQNWFKQNDATITEWQPK